MVHDRGSLIFLIEESAAMGSPIAEGSKSKAECVATALNALLLQLTPSSSTEIAIVGYKTDLDDIPLIGSGFMGSLEGREFVPLAELQSLPLRSEDRVRRIPLPGEQFREETVSIPIWYVPSLGKNAPQSSGFSFCKDLIERQQATASQAIVLFHIHASQSADGNPDGILAQLMAMPCRPLLYHLHLSSSDTAPPILYPSSKAALPPGVLRSWFDRSSSLPKSLAQELQHSKVTTQPGARGLVYHARLKELIQHLGLAKACVRDWSALEQVEVKPIAQSNQPRPAMTPVAPPPPPAPLKTKPAASFPPGALKAATPGKSSPMYPPPPPVPAQSLEAILIPTPDVIVPIPAGWEGESPATTSSSDFLWEFGSQPTVVIETVSASDAPSESLPEPESDTPLGTAKALLLLLLDRSLENPGSASMKNPFIQLQDHANQLLNDLAKKGEGRFDIAIAYYGRDALGNPDVKVHNCGKQSGSFCCRDTDLPGSELRVEETIEQVSNGIGGLVEVTRKKRVYLDLEPLRAGCLGDAIDAVRPVIASWSSEHPGLPLVVVHLSRGGSDGTELDKLATPGEYASSVVLNHLLVPEEPHKSVAYPTDVEEIQGSNLRALWQRSSPILGAERLEGPKKVSQGARGFVINGKLDLLLPGLIAAVEKR